MRLWIKRKKHTNNKPYYTDLQNSLNFNFLLSVLPKYSELQLMPYKL